MIRIFLLAIGFLLQAAVTSAQTSADQRAVNTKIADLLAVMPAENKTQLNKSMQMISTLNEKGLRELIGMLTPEEKGDNTKVEYALAGYSFYVTQPGNEAKRQLAVKAYCASLSALSDTYNKEFIIRQLQMTGKDDAVPCLQSYLKNEMLAGPAARALAQINTPAAEKALLSALKSSNGATRLALVDALGYARYTPALASVNALAASSDPDLKKVSLYTLSRIANPSSAKVFAAAAKSAGYRFDNTNATYYYLQYLRQMAAAGKTTEVEKLAKDLMQQTAQDNQLHTRIAAMKILVDAKKEKSLPLLFEAMKDNNREYRAAALAFAKPYSSAAVNKQWVNTLSKVSPEAKAQVIEMLGNTKDKSVQPVILAALKDNNADVQLAAISVSAQRAGQAEIQALLNIMKTGNPGQITAVKDALLQIPGNQVVTSVSASLNDMPPAAKAALIEVLAERADSRVTGVVLSHVNSSDTAVRKAAILALPNLVQQQDMQQLFTLLNNAGKQDEIGALQRAIIAASASIKDTAERSRLVIDQMISGKTKPQNLLEVLGAIGGDQAINELNAAYKNGDEQTKRAAITALSRANGKSAARALLAIAQDQAHRNAALNGYIQLISRSEFAGEQKLLMLQEAMQLAQTDAQRRSIIREVGRCNTFPALVFAGEYLDNSALQQEAANAVMNIALANKQFNGDIVRRLLTKTADMMKGGDAEYLKVAIQKHLAEMPPGEGFVSMFNGKDLSGWKGLVENPIKRSKMDAAALSAAQEKADKEMKEGWKAQDGLLVFTGHGNNLATVKQYGDFEMFVDWKITPEGDAGIYLRGTPQVQIWDTSRRQVGAQVGSGGLYNNQKNASKPLVVADNAIGEWNNFHIIMKGDKVTVYLNGQLVTDSVTMENYWDRTKPIFPKEQIELQAHGTYVAYRNLYIKELNASSPFVLSEEEKKEGFKVLFDGTNLDEWTGNKTDYVIDNGDIFVKPATGSRGNLYTKDQFGDFVFRFEFQLTPGANNGLGIRTPMEGDAAYAGMELQILDNTAEIYKNLKPYQFHGSVYGIIPAKTGHLKPVGEWNYQEVIAKGSKIKVILNNEVILDGDIEAAVKNGTPDGREHPGLKNKKGHIGFLGHGSVLRFRNIRIREL
jgi:HEAT repeat protein